MRKSINNKCGASSSSLVAHLSRSRCHFSFTISRVPVAKGDTTNRVVVVGTKFCIDKMTQSLIFSKDWPARDETPNTCFSKFLKFLIFRIHFVEKRGMMSSCPLFSFLVFALAWETRSHNSTPTRRTPTRTPTRKQWQQEEQHQR